MRQKPATERGGGLALSLSVAAALGKAIGSTVHKLEWQGVGLHLGSEARW